MPEETILRPQDILAHGGFLARGASVADFGCGHGYFTMPMASAVSQKGQVFAIDVRPQALSFVASRAKRLGFLQIRTILGDLERERGSTLPDQSCDMVVVADLLYQTRDPKQVLSEAKRILKAGGRALVIDWQAEGAVYGPPQTQRIGKDRVEEIARELGFLVHGTFSFGKYHWGLVLGA